MKFGSVPIADARGAILAHRLKVGTSTFKKGRVLSAEDIEALAAEKIRTVVAARLERGDVPEDGAAGRVGLAVSGDGIVVSAAFTGRCNLYAQVRGVAVISAERVTRINLTNEAITVATVAPLTLVEPRQMVATVKIIPFAVRSKLLRRVEGIAAKGESLISVAPLRKRRAGLIQTTLPETKSTVLEGTVATTRARLEALGSELVAARVVAHEVEAITVAISDLRARHCDPILILGSSATVDRRDVVPSAIVAAGGQVFHYGMPVDPGNLSLVACVEDVAVIGLPGCARSSKPNGFDWILRRTLADLPVTSSDIMQMGVGGLLSESPARPLPRRAAAPQPSDGLTFAPRVAAVVLAAGCSTRMAPTNKLLAEIGGRSLIESAVDTALASRAEPVLVVVGFEGSEVEKTLADRPVTIVRNPDFRTGMSSSLRAGVAVLPGGIEAAVFLLADMPGVQADHIDRLIAAFDASEERSICISTFRNKRGNPVLWASRYFPEIRALSGDTGARALLQAHADQVCEVEMADEGVLIDIDSPEDLSRFAETGKKEKA